MTKIVAIIQARMGSTRLPGKVLKAILGKPMLFHEIERVSRAKNIDEIVIATTDQPADDKIVSLCKKNSWNYYRGSENDVLDRYYQSAIAFHAGIIVRITADCPLIDPVIIDQTIDVFLKSKSIDYVSNSLPVMTFPRGLDTEIMSMTTLKKVWIEDKNPGWREHVTPYIERNPSKFRIKGHVYSKDFSYLRWTVDTPADLQFVRKIYNHFKNNEFSWNDVVDLLKQHPEYIAINRNVQQKVIV
jgi:spore coat polysaccharide biosynthesis protein SpsF